MEPRRLHALFYEAKSSILQMSAKTFRTTTTLIGTPEKYKKSELPEFRFLVVGGAQHEAVEPSNALSLKMPSAPVIPKTTHILLLADDQIRSISCVISQ